MIKNGTTTMLTSTPFLLALLFLPNAAWASGEPTQLDLTATWMGITSVVLFILAYALVYW